MMGEYTHGDPTRGITVPVGSLEAYPGWAAAYIRAENPSGEITAKADLADGWALADHWGRPIDLASPPSRRVVHFVHAVRAVHRWENAGKKTEDSHVYHFDVTRLLPDARKDEIEEALGLQREEAV